MRGPGFHPFPASTTPHNLTRSPWQLVTVVLGAHDLQSPEPGQQKFTITQVFQNNYNPEENLNDVLLVQVGRDWGSTSAGDTWGAPPMRRNYGAVTVWDWGLSVSF